MFSGGFVGIGASNLDPHRTIDPEGLGGDRVDWSRPATTDQCKRMDAYDADPPGAVIVSAGSLDRRKPSRSCRSARCESCCGSAPIGSAIQTSSAAIEAEKPEGDSIMLGGGDLDANPFRRLFETDPVGEAFLSEEAFETYVRAFERTGFRGGINWYRNLDRNREFFSEIGSKKLDLPCLMVTAEWDRALTPALAEGMPDLCNDLEIHMIKECGHWTQQEKPR